MLHQHPQHKFSARNYYERGKKSHKAAGACSGTCYGHQGGQGTVALMTGRKVMPPHHLLPRRGTKSLCQQLPPQEGFPRTVYGALQKCCPVSPTLEPRNPPTRERPCPGDTGTAPPCTHHLQLHGEDGEISHRSPLLQLPGVRNPSGLGKTSPGAAFIPAQKINHPQAAI